MEDTSKKVPLEELSHEELLKKCRGLVNILQKAKQSKDTVIEENGILKQKVESNTATEQLLQKLTQQKVDLLTALEETKSQKDIFQRNWKESELNFSNATEKIVELDTANQGLKRQLGRVTEENEQILSDLDALEKQVNEFKSKQEKLDSMVAELKELKSSNELLLGEKENLNSKNKELFDNLNEMVQGADALKANLKEAENTIENLKATLKEKNQQSEAYDDLNTELHKNKALVEKLKGDIANLSSKLTDNQIVSSGVTSDLQNTNERLKEKLKFFHSKVVKFAGDIKALRLQKDAVLEEFKHYVEQVNVWKLQLQESTPVILSQFEKVENLNQQLKTENESCKSQLNSVLSKNEDLLRSSNKLKEEMTAMLKNKEGELQASKAIYEERLNEFKIKKDQEENEKGLLQNKIVELQESNVKLAQEFEESKSYIEELLSHNKRLNEQLNETKDNISNANDLNLKYTDLLQELEKSKVHLNELTNSHHYLSLKCSGFEGDNQRLVAENEKKLDELKLQEANLQGLSSKIEILLKKNSELSDLHSDNQKTTADLNERLQAKIETINQLTEENRSLIEKLDVLENKIKEVQSSTSKLASQQEQLNVVKTENAELLKEMNEMNQVLKERGETISKQQQYCEELLKNVKGQDSQNSKSSEMIRQKEEIISKLEQEIRLLKEKDKSASESSTVSLNEMHEALVKKDEEIIQLRGELLLFKEKMSQSLEMSQESNLTDIETMSTSTISRTEELNRIKDLEGAWEERYGKLRLLALKLKGKIRELTNDIVREQNEKTEFQQKLTSSLKTTQTLQVQCDKVQDELDKSKRDVVELLKKLDTAALDISKNKKQLVDNDEVITKLKADIEAANKDKTNTDNWKKQVSTKVQNLRKELEAKNLLKKDFENQISKLQSQVEEKEKLLNEEIERHSSTKSSLQESHNECKKQSVLNLEMQDYERSLKDLTQKLDKKQELINKLKNQVETQKGTVSALKEQNCILEDRFQHAEVYASSTKSEIQTYKKSISELEAVLIKKDDKVHELTRSLENCRIENEDFSTQLSKIVAEHQKVTDMLKSEKDYLRSQNLGLEQKVRETQETLKLRESELKRIETEYQNYKIRAQSVLRQNQTRDIGLEEKLSEEAAGFKAKVAILTTELAENKTAIKKLEEENGIMKVENMKLKENSNFLSEELKDQTRICENMSHSLHRTITEHAEAIRNIKVQGETLAQCYRQQLSDQEVRHNREIIELQSKIEKVVPVVPEVPPLSPPSIPREQGEGSESNETRPLNTHPVPLDRLLSNESDPDVSFLKKQLAENEAKVVHLTALLADTEQDLAKHVQMNKLLKEEIRRQQRSVEREQHAENLEYLKNVVFKFATLNSGDERSRLVPVLNTILKFSPEETQKLNMVARADPGLRAWTNYLPAWPSGSKPQ